MQSIADFADEGYLSSFPLRDRRDGRITPPPSYYDLFPQTVNNQVPGNVDIQVSEPTTVSNIQSERDHGVIIVYEPSTGNFNVRDLRTANQRSKDNKVIKMSCNLFIGFICIVLVICLLKS